MSQVIPTIDVSTHSRPKAAGRIRTDGGGAIMFQHTAARRRLVSFAVMKSVQDLCFNTQPPEGGWASAPGFKRRPAVSTHSRPKAAG